MKKRKKAETTANANPPPQSTVNPPQTTVKNPTNPQQNPLNQTHHNPPQSTATHSIKTHRNPFNQTHRNPPRSPDPLRPPRSPVIYNPSPPSQDHAGCNYREKKTRGEGDCCEGDEGHGGWLGENRDLLGERESRGGKQTREIFWKMVYGKFFRKPVS